MKRAVLIAVGSVILGGILGVALVWYQQPTRTYRTVTGDQINTVTTDASSMSSATNTDATTSHATSTPSTRQTTDNEFDQCVTRKRQEANGQDYEQGALLVSFTDGTSFSAAVDTLEQVGVTASTSERTKNQYEERGWFEISVSQAALFQTQCRLEQMDVVGTTRLNVTFDLAD